MTNIGKCESLERRRQIRKDKLNEHQTKQARRLELMEKVVSAVDGAISPLRAEINFHESVGVRILSRFEGLPDVYLELDCNGVAELHPDDDLPF
jgi:hypothetical protein